MPHPTGQERSKLALRQMHLHPAPMQDKEPIHVFVYGTLKPGGHYWAQFCEGKVSEATPAMVKGLLFHLPMGYPALCIDHTDCWAHGFILTLTNEAALAGFDFLEGYHATRSENKNEYQRVRFDALTGNKQKLNVWTYVMKVEKIDALGGTPVPGGNWQQ